MGVSNTDLNRGQLVYYIIYLYLSYICICLICVFVLYVYLSYMCICLICVFVTFVAPDMSRLENLSLVFFFWFVELSLSLRLVYVYVYVCLNICMSQACVKQETAPQFVSVYVYVCVFVHRLCLLRVQACFQLMAVADTY